MSAGATPDDREAATPDAAACVTEILARFAQTADADESAPTGTVQLAGHAPVEFAGWLDLMARVEEMLASDRERRVP